MKNLSILYTLIAIVACMIGLTMEAEALATLAMSAPFIVSTSEQRGAYGRICNWFPANGMGHADNFIITEASLRVEQLLATNKNQYEFDLYEGSSQSDRPTEIKLNRNDLFFATHIALGITKQNATLTPAWYGNYPVFTHPDPNYFVVAGTPAEYQALETIYNGTLKFTTGSVDRLGQISTALFKYVPEAQYQIASGDQVNDEYPQYGPTMEARGFHRITPNLVIDGGQTNKFSVNLGAGNISTIDGATANVNTRNVLVLQVYGFRAVNAAAAAKQAAISPASF